MENSVSIALRVIGVLEIVAGFVVGSILGYEDIGYGREMNFRVVFFWGIIGVISGTLFIGLSEITRLLHDINKKLNMNFNITDEVEETTEEIIIKKGSSKYEQWKQLNGDNKDIWK